MGVRSQAFGGISKAEADALVDAAVAANLSTLHDLAAIPEELMNKMSPVFFRLHAATGTAQQPSYLNNNDTGAGAIFNAVDEYCEVDFWSHYIVTQFRYYGATNMVEDGRYKIQYWNGSDWVDLNTNIPTRVTASWTDWTDLTIPVFTTKIRVVATAIDTYGKNWDGEWEMRG